MGIGCSNCLAEYKEQEKKKKEEYENQKIIKERKLERYYRLHYLDYEAIKKLGENYRTNVQLLLKIDDENNILVQKMKKK